MNTIVDKTGDVLHQRYVTEDMANIPFGILLKLIRAQVFFPLALIAVITIKVTTKIKGRSDALNAVCLDANSISFDSMPKQARTSFAGLANQLPQFRWILFQQRQCLGLRQQFDALALHENGTTIAMCEWQQQMVVVHAVKGEDPVKSTESVTTDLVSFTSDNKTLTTCHAPADSLPVFSLYDEGLGEVDAISNQERLTSVVEKHLARIAGCSLNVMNEEDAIKSAEKRSDQILNHFLKLGLVRQLLSSEVPKLQKIRRKHAAEFEPYIQV